MNQKRTDGLEDYRAIAALKKSEGQSQFSQQERYVRTYVCVMHGEIASPIEQAKPKLAS